MSRNILNEFLSNGYQSEYVILISLISILFGILIIIAKNPIISILFLIGLFVSVSIYLMLLGLTFMGLSYLLVYVGAVSILFIFILMLISVRISELLTEGKNSIPLAIMIVFSFNFIVSSILAYSVHTSDLLYNFIIYIYQTIIAKLPLDLYITSNSSFIMTQEINSKIANVTSSSWDSSLVETSHITSIGNVLYSNLLVLLIITSLILLLAMVGTIVITTKKKFLVNN